jgi:hypothetical protein
MKYYELDEYQDIYLDQVACYGFAVMICNVGLGSIGWFTVLKAVHNSRHNDK